VIVVIKFWTNDSGKSQDPSRRKSYLILPTYVQGSGPAGIISVLHHETREPKRLANTYLPHMFLIHTA
jgi:hypothetical protein